MLNVESIPKEKPSEIRCPECAGDRHATPTCGLCAGAGTVTRHEFQQWHARREGRP